MLMTSTFSSNETPGGSMSRLCSVAHSTADMAKSVVWGAPAGVPNTFSATRLAAGATPGPMLVAATPSPAMMPETWVPWGKPPFSMESMGLSSGVGSSLHTTPGPGTQPGE